MKTSQLPVLGAGPVGLAAASALKTRGQPLVVLDSERGVATNVTLPGAILDSSGAWQTPDSRGASGLPAAGELEAQARIFYGIPDFRGALRARYSGARVLVVGSGDSAFDVLLGLRELAGRGTRATWAVRERQRAQLFGGEARHGLPESGRLGSRVRALVESSEVELLRGFETAAVSVGAFGLTVTSADGKSTIADEVIVASSLR